MPLVYQANLPHIFYYELTFTKLAAELIFTKLSWSLYGKFCRIFIPLVSVDDE